MDLSAYPHVLVVFAHPDDAESLFGGTVRQLAKSGAEINYVVCTDGSRGGPDAETPDEEVAQTRADEQLAAARVLGVNEVVFLGYKNGTLEVTVDLRRDIVRQIRRFRPELILTMPPFRVLDAPISLSHAEHIAAGEATLVASYPEAGSVRAYPELLDEGLQPHRVTEVWIPAFGDADRFVDVTDVIDTKIEALQCHESQMGKPGRRAWDFERDMKPGMQAVGARIGCTYAESFRVIPIGR
jgi:LmbE family N-acetylglucosaminyl deacetylase